MKTKHTLVACLALPFTAQADDAFDSAIRPITAPTVVDLAVPRTQVHGIYMHQNLPSKVNVAALNTVPLGGDFNLYALQFEIALDNRTSIVATKDGYIDFNPDSTLTPDEGFANLGVGLKRALIYKPETNYILSGIATVEFPIGESQVWQGEGDGALNLNLAGLKLYDRLQISSNLGLHIPFDSSQSFTGSVSLHASYEVTPLFIPLIELNWYHTFDEGDGTSSFTNQGGTLVPSVAQFEGGDLINLGAANADDNPDTVTLGLGFRSRVNENATFGVAYEIPLTDEENGLLDDRFTVDFVWKF
ncbi:autotransporter outer membrane beta-barrel domain-containing protein [Akkermansiaceae bacterium]|nr:autotransporter outer membrane beta-barrel domain-containing protein [Akkermansiaceae bacterium]